MQELTTLGRKILNFFSYLTIVLIVLGINFTLSCSGLPTYKGPVELSYIFTGSYLETWEAVNKAAIAAELATMISDLDNGLQVFEKKLGSGDIRLMTNLRDKGAQKITAGDMILNVKLFKEEEARTRISIKTNIWAYYKPVGEEEKTEVIEVETIGCYENRFFYLVASLLRDHKLIELLENIYGSRYKNIKRELDRKIPETP